MIMFFVRDTPRPGGSKRAFHSKGKTWIVDANKNTKTWRESVRQAALKAYKGKPLKEALEVTHEFFFRRPSSHYGTGKNQNQLKLSAPKYHTKKPDLTKLIRSTEDALTGIIWVDDSQVISRTDLKRYCNLENEGASITIRIIE
jgi:Holliday junction resolvase RusA-like endonuclease